MSNFAIIEDGIVINAIVAETKSDAEEATGKIAVEYGDEEYVVIGSTWDGKSFTPPVTLTPEE